MKSLILSLLFLVAFVLMSSTANACLRSRIRQARCEGRRPLLRVVTMPLRLGAATVERSVEVTRKVRVRRVRRAGCGG